MYRLVGNHIFCFSLFDFKETLQSVSQIKTTFFIMVNPLFAPAASSQNLASVADSKQKILSQN